jgi:hypothetical protein
MYALFYHSLLFFFSSSDVPKVKFKLGSKLDPSNIKVGDDVYFECAIDSNPAVFKTFFTKDVRISRLF